MKQFKNILLLLTVTIQKLNPVYNVIERDPMKNPNNPMVPQLTTNYEQMMLDRSKRLVTIGEPQKDPLRHIEFSPIHHYDEEVEFVNDQLKQKITADYTPFNDKEVNNKETEIEQMILSYYDLKSQAEMKEFKKGEDSTINKFLIIISNAQQGLSLEEIHILDKIRQLVVLLRNKEATLKQDSPPHLIAEIQQKVKNLSFLLDQRDWQSKIVASLDTDIFTYNRTMQQLDAPLKYYANRVSFLIKKGEAFDQAAFADIGNFAFFAQRKSKLQMIYRKMSIVRAKNITGDLAGQQNAMITLVDELQQELDISESDLRPLNVLQNQMALIAPYENVQQINQVMKQCIDQMVKFPEIALICKDIYITHDFSTVNTFKKLSFMIKQEVAEYQNTIQSLITQMQLARAAQDAVNLRYISNVYQDLNRIATEVQNNQKKISANVKISGLIMAMNSFREKEQTVILSLQNIDNVLFETNKGTFWNMQDAQEKEFKDGSDFISKKLNTQRMLIDKLIEAAGKVAVETTPENCHQTEELLENIILFMQRQDKLIKMTKFLSQKDYQKIEEGIYWEIEQLKNRVNDYKTIIDRLTQLEINLYQMNIKSAQEICKSLIDNKNLKAFPKMRLAQAYEKLVIEERRQAAEYLQMAHKEIDMNSISTISSEQDLQKQLNILSQLKKQPQQQLENELIQITEVTQDMVITNQDLEKLLLSVRENLRDAKGIEAKDKILLFVNKDQNESHDTEITSLDIQNLSQQVKGELSNDELEIATRHVDQLIQLIQQAEKNVDINYTIKAILFKGQKGMVFNNHCQDLLTSIQKEYFSLENKLKQIDNNKQQLSKLYNETKYDNSAFVQKLIEIRELPYINSKFNDMIRLALQLANNNDMQNSKQTIKDAIDKLTSDQYDYELSIKSVDQQQQILNDKVNTKDFMQMFTALQQIQKLVKQQIIVITDEDIYEQQTQFIKFRYDRDILKALDILSTIQQKGINYIAVSQQKAIELHDSFQTFEIQENKEKNQKKVKKNKKKNLRK